MSFLVQEAKHRLSKNKLVHLSSLIEWDKLGAKMGKLGRSGYGPQGYPPVGLLKAVILQVWHNLSDEALEEALRVRLYFMVITGLNPVPDHTILYRFRNRLTQLQLWDVLLAEVNRQQKTKILKSKSLKEPLLMPPLLNQRLALVRSSQQLLLILKKM